MKHIRFTQSPTNETNHREKYSRRNREVDHRRNREDRNREEEDRNRDEEYRNQEEEDRNRRNQEEEDRNRRNREKEEKFGFLKDVPVIKTIIIGLIILFVIYICYKLYIHFTKKTSDKQSVIIDDIKIEESDLLDINSDSETESVIDEDDVGRIDDIVIEGTKTGLPIANMRYVYF